MTINFDILSGIQLNDAATNGPATVMDDSLYYNVKDAVVTNALNGSATLRDDSIYYTVNDISMNANKIQLFNSSPMLYGTTTIEEAVTRTCEEISFHDSEIAILRNEILELKTEMATMESKLIDGLDKYIEYAKEEMMATLRNEYSDKQCGEGEDISNATWNDDHVYKAVEPGIIRMESKAVNVASRQLSAGWTIESETDLECTHGLDVEVELLQMLQHEIARELDRDTIIRLQKLAGIQDSDKCQASESQLSTMWPSTFGKLSKQTIAKQDAELYHRFEKAHTGVLSSIVRRTMPSMIAHDICGVQPMTGPIGSIHNIRTNFGIENPIAKYDLAMAGITA